jgi:hypothetical protein
MTKPYCKAFVTFARPLLASQKECGFIDSTRYWKTKDMINSKTAILTSSQERRNVGFETHRKETVRGEVPGI